jgi:predicted metal-dependent peptidase
MMKKTKNDNKLQNLEKLSELSSLWEEDEKTQQQINNIIDDAEKSSQWGSIGSNIQELIKANRKVEMNYASILRHFNTSIISSKRNLSRMKPNRRFGFDRLGSRYSLSSKLLIAVDISSSITQENLEYFFSVINQFFRYGVEQIDVILFDTKIHGEPIEMKKLFKQIYIEGRGGTDFQPVADFYCSHKEYDGLIYFTDGFGPHPKFNGRSDVKVLWIFTSKHCYDKGIKWTEKLPNNNATFIPLPY